MTASPEAHPVVVQPDTGRHLLRLALFGDLDYDSGEEILHLVRQALGAHKEAHELVLDCRELRLVDSMGLSVLLQVHRDASEGGRRCHLEAVGPSLERLLRITGTFDHLTAPGPASASPSTSRSQAACDTRHSGA
ncbi:STAS domain-containing protein [Streptomyces sp. NPDC057116]|uniref:STAS domain-containing protein n=1 Tax=Streptomyces sp. NPDC057116 TaxID=3346023 RepID=UPI003634501E